jgi:hypothetical protein
VAVIEPVFEALNAAGARSVCGTRRTRVDLFVESPIDFAALWERAEVLPLDATNVRVACIADLVALKRLAGRPHDLADIEALEAIAARRSR